MIISGGADGYEADTENNSETDSEAGVDEENQSLPLNEDGTAGQDDENQQHEEGNVTEQNLPNQLEGLTIHDDNKGKLAIYTREEAAKFLAKSTGKKQGMVSLAFTSTLSVSSNYLNLGRRS